MSRNAHAQPRLGHKQRRTTLLSIVKEVDVRTTHRAARQTRRRAHIRWTSLTASFRLPKRFRATSIARLPCATAQRCVALGVSFGRSCVPGALPRFVVPDLLDVEIVRTLLHGAGSGLPLGLGGRLV
jgi:hypothetical protein